MGRRQVLRVHACGVELDAAALCLELDCNTVFDRSAVDRCPRCGGAESYPLAVWLDRGHDANHRHQRPTLAHLIASPTG
jgi:Zn-finger nucleic acid-binding protein